MEKLEKKSNIVTKVTIVIFSLIVTVLFVTTIEFLPISKIIKEILQEVGVAVMIAAFLNCLIYEIKFVNEEIRDTKAALNSYTFRSF